MVHEMRLKSASVNAFEGNRSETHKAGVGLIHHVSSPQTIRFFKVAWHFPVLNEFSFFMRERLLFFF